MSIQIPHTWPQAHEFACHSPACRPPQSGGTGGSTGGRSGGSGSGSGSGSYSGRGTGGSGRGRGAAIRPAFQHMTDHQLQASRLPAHKAELARRKSQNKEVFLAAEEKGLTS